jgi:integrase/recombinase XerD
MKKKITIRRLYHRDKRRYAIFFDIDNNLISLVKSINGVKWSQSNKCWYANDDEETLKQIITVFREDADIDISAIVSGDKEKIVPPLADHKIERNLEKSRPDPVPVPGSVSVNNSTSSPDSTCKEFLSENDDIPEEIEVIRNARNSSVVFTISEPDGLLVIKFIGGYEPEWIKELKEFGRPYFDKVRREWLLQWSQITVDSLSDYFSSQGVDIIVKKTEVPLVLQGQRDEKGNEIRQRNLSAASLKGIDLVAGYLDEKRYSKRTRMSYLSHLELFFKYFHEKDPLDINEEDISAFIQDFVIGLGYSSSYQNLIISAIKMYYSLYGEKRVDLESFDRPRRRRALPKVLSKDEIMKIFSVTRNNKHKLILWLIYSCGLRRSEVINIRLTDLDTGRNILHIREGKGNVDRVVPIPQKVWEKIRTYINGYKPVTYLFEGQTGGKYSVESVYSVFKKSLRRAGIKKDVGVHSLRHSYATHLHEGGLDIRYIQELLGHKSTRTTEIYTHVSRRNLFAIRSPIEDMDIE